MHKFAFVSTVKKYYVVKNFCSLFGLSQEVLKNSAIGTLDMYAGFFLWKYQYNNLHCLFSKCAMYKFAFMSTVKKYYVAEMFCSLFDLESSNKILR